MFYCKSCRFRQNNVIALGRVRKIEDIKRIIAKNIVELRHLHSITQANLAEQLNYSDKAVSKWERGESVPDISVLKRIADIFGVTVDYLITEDHAKNADEPVDIVSLKKKNRLLITGISILLVCFIATCVFVFVRLIMGFASWHWLIYAYAVPVSAIVALVFNSIWFNPRKNYLIVSILMWTLMAVIYFTFFFVDGPDITLLFVIGVPAQIIIILWSGIGKKPKLKFKKKAESVTEKSNEE